MNGIHHTLPRNLEHLRLLADSLKDQTVWLNNAEGDILYVSAGVKAQYGVEPEALIGKNAMIIVDEGMATDQALYQSLQTGGPGRAICTTRIGRRVGIITIPLFDPEGHIWRVLGISRILDSGEEERDIPGKPQMVREIRPSEMPEPEFVVESEQMRGILESLERVAQSEATVMLMGESGVGKDGLAYMLHRFSKRADRPCVVINCAAIPEKLIESELFGYEKGAFTSATQSKMGLLELANHGTVFLDEVGDLPAYAQGKLLRCLQNRQVMRIGGKKVIDLDVRFITATNRPVEDMVAAGTFREDLYYRLNVIKLRIPPLRERDKDILPLVHHFLDKFNAQYGTNKKFARASLRLLQAHSWPGNVRELENAVEQAVVLCPLSIIGPAYLPESITARPGTGGGSGEVPTLRDAMEHCEKKLLREARRKFQSSRSMARALGCDQSTVVRKLKKYGLE